MAPPAATARPARRRTGWRWLGRMALVVLLGPALLILVLRFVPPLVTPLMLVRLAEGYGLERRWVPLDEISPHLRDAVVASEDNLFCEHWGFDTAALEGQIRAALEGERPRGASTITQQTAKNVFLWPGRDPVRKLLEAWLTPSSSFSGASGASSRSTSTWSSSVPASTAPRPRPGTGTASPRQR